MSLRPKKLWEGEKEWLAWYYDGGDAVAPSVIGVYRRRIGAVVSLVIGFLLIGICLYQGTLLAGLPNVPPGHFSHAVDRGILEKIIHVLLPPSAQQKPVGFENNF